MQKISLTPDPRWFQVIFQAVFLLYGIFMFRPNGEVCAGELSFLALKKVNAPDFDSPDEAKAYISKQHPNI